MHTSRRRFLRDSSALAVSAGLASLTGIAGLTWLGRAAEARSAPPDVPAARPDAPRLLGVPTPGAALIRAAPYTVKPAHPRLFIDDLADLKRRARGPLAADYAIVKARADAAVKQKRVRGIDRKWGVPEDLMNLGLSYLVEGDPQYARTVVDAWGDGKIVSNPKDSHFGYHAIAYDWIFDALSEAERRRYGNALGGWLRYFTGKPQITLKWGHWEYNQTWGPIHLNVMNARDAIAPKLLVALAIFGAGTGFDADARAFCDSWATRIPKECLPAFARMGGVWSESYGHGAYGPVTVIPYAFAAWRSATGIDLFAATAPSAFPVEMPRWIAYTMMPHNERTAFIDDGSGATPAAFARAAPFLRDGLSQWFSDRGRDWLQARWQRVAAYDPKRKAVPPGKTLPLAYCFKGAGHVYMRSAWNDPNATWAFFGAGPQFGGHSRDDEGHFLICKQGALVSRQGGQGHNDDDYYAGGSLIYNVVTIFDPKEKFRRTKNNERDGGLQRHVYQGGPWPRERGKLVAFAHDQAFTYAAADLTKAYRATKVREVTRQFLYLRGTHEFFVIFDRITATNPAFPRHFFLHVPDEPKRLRGVLSWLSADKAHGDASLLSAGRARLYLYTLLPKEHKVLVRGGPGRDAWGHPLEPTAQYNHESKKRNRPPICPWRIEVGDPSRGAETRFLHVLALTPEGDRTPPRVKLVGTAGVDLGGHKVRFNAKGAIGGRLDGKRLATTVDVASQYEGRPGAGRRGESRRDR